jgi:hypothetical protein
VTAIWLAIWGANSGMICKTKGMCGDFARRISFTLKDGCQAFTLIFKNQRGVAILGL